MCRDQIADRSSQPISSQAFLKLRHKNIPSTLQECGGDIFI
jgi:hypothetical protein